MLLLFHIAVALSSVLYTAYILFAPTQNRLRISYTLVALTLFTGAVLLFTNSSHLNQVCITGIAYLGVVSVCSIATRHKLARLTMN